MCYSVSGEMAKKGLMYYVTKEERKKQNERREKERMNRRHEGRKEGRKKGIQLFCLVTKTQVNEFFSALSVLIHVQIIKGKH